MSLKKIIKEEMDDFEWIRKSQFLPLDIAKDLVNQTEIIPDAFMGEPMIKVPFTNLQFNEPGRFVHLPSLNKYIKTNYGIEDNLTTSSIVNMWSAMTKEKMKKTLTESNELQWIKDIKTNNDIAQEIYDGLEWYKEPNVSTNFVRPQWNDYNFSVRTSKENKEKVVIHPHSFHIGFTQYLLDNWGIYDVLEKRKIMKRVKELINQKIR